jgi:hypothetical protein
MKSNESLHITVKDPPLTVKSLGVFCNLPDAAILPIIEQFLSQEEPKDEKFLTNTKEECYLLLTKCSVLTVSVMDDIYTIKLRKNP